jgi:hypothetical protein
VKIELPDGNWAVLASPKKVQERKRRRYMLAMADLAAATNHLPKQMTLQENGLTLEETDYGSADSHILELSDRTIDQMILCLVKDWSFGAVDEPTLAELNSECFDGLRRECQKLAPDLVPDYSPDPDPKALRNGQHGSPPDSSTAEIYETPPSVSTS